MFGICVLDCCLGRGVCCLVDFMFVMVCYTLDGCLGAFMGCGNRIYVCLVLRVTTSVGYDSFMLCVKVSLLRLFGGVGCFTLLIWGV